jgi:cytochrome c
MPDMNSRSIGFAGMLGLAGAAMLTAAPASAQAGPNGENLFKMRCAACHSVVAGKTSVLAPNLNGVVGRKAASTGFNYSAALKASGLTWTPANLDKWLQGPMKLVPGTRMVIMVPNPAERAALIGYLKTAH